MKWTKGPWKAFTDGARKVWLIISTNDDLPADEQGAPGIAVSNEADAHLIAAAPDLAEALVQCAESLAFARDKLGITGEGDGQERKADAADDIGSLSALLAARAALAKAGAK
ncbi:MAG: hypothetical protein KIT32_12130 [Rhodocyclaceae bacterium]|nr:hypothetical protein [Rhodocyclaceae bacterium]